ncbi:hypothetical protein FNV43_RR10046 [Rhamnella rubrinervis]|nr:hypothetical protein FNV43_RR10046 [Rhamnella rubrinervis]
MKEGRELANQLRGVLFGSGSPAVDLVMKISKSFSNILSILNVNDFNYEHPISQIQAELGLGLADSPCLDARKSQESFIDGDCNKKRKTSHTQIRKTPFPIADGHAWRKYGEKNIMKAKYPRSYYRCTHIYDQNCKAIKQVQRIQEDPCLYQTTYIGHHTCTNFLAPPKLNMDCTSPGEPASTFISFETTNKLTDKHELSCVSSSPSMKSESRLKKTCDMDHNDQLLSISDYFMPPDPTS